MSLRVGSTVRIVGLAGRADLNGQRARCINLDAAAARWAVRCIDSDEGVRVRPSNLELIAGSINGQDPQAVDALHERTAREAAEATALDFSLQTKKRGTAARRTSTALSVACSSLRQKPGEQLLCCSHTLQCGVIIEASGSFILFSGIESYNWDRR